MLPFGRPAGDEVRVKAGELGAQLVEPERSLDVVRTLMGHAHRGLDLSVAERQAPDRVDVVCEIHTAPPPTMTAPLPEDGP